MAGGILRETQRCRLVVAVFLLSIPVHLVSECLVIKDMDKI